MQHLECTKLRHIKAADSIQHTCTLQMTFPALQRRGIADWAEIFYDRAEVVVFRVTGLMSNKLEP
jgi:hypothetical protein